MNECTLTQWETDFTNPDRASYVGAPFVMPISLSVRSDVSQRAWHSAESRWPLAKADCRLGRLASPQPTPGEGHVHAN
jgi:hypothetical protein